jgi:hypothetical protein
LDTDIPNDRPAISKVLFFRAYNNTGASIPANSFVRLTGGITANLIPYIALADATSAANATVAGFVSNGINNGAYGFVYSSGLVEGFNASGLGAGGDVLFLSATPGQSSNVAPVSPNTVVQVARVLSNDSVNGKISVQIQLRQAYGRPNGQLLYAYANNITSSNSISVNDGTGTLTVTGPINPQKGFIYTPTVYPSAQTAITIDFANNSVVRAQTAAGLVVTLSNFVTGKVVEAWITNTAGTNQTFTHGISAVNSTVNATTYTIPGTSTIFVKYWSMDGTLANTFVAITK